MTRWERELAERLGNGYWHNMVSHEIQEGGIGFWQWVKYAIATGMMQARGLLEADDAWIRLTPKGMAELTPDSAAERAADPQGGQG